MMGNKKQNYPLRFVQRYVAVAIEGVRLFLLTVPQCGMSSNRLPV